MDFEISADDLKVFLEEAEEQLQLLEEDIVKLEQAADDEQLLQEIFRAAHTLKGSSATLGHQKMADLTHRMENILDKLRKRQLSMNSNIVDVLFKCLDVLRILKEEIASGQVQDIDMTQLLAELEGVVGTGGNPPSTPSRNPSAAGVRQGSDDLDTEIMRQAAKFLQEGKNVLNLRFKIDSGAAMPSVRAFQTLVVLGDVGEIIFSQPSQSEIEEEKAAFDLRVILVTMEDPGTVKQTASSVTEVYLTEMSELRSAGGSNQDHSAGASKPVPKADVAGPGSKTAIAKKTSRTVRVDVEVLDSLMNLVGELVIDRGRLTQIAGTMTQLDGGELAQDLSRTSSHIGRVTTDLQEEIMRARMQPIENLFKKFPRMVRDLAQAFNKEIDLVIKGEETELDRSVIEEIGDPLMHLLRNAIDHGIESRDMRQAMGKPLRGRVSLEASHEENSIIITVKDDGRGIDTDRVRAKALEKGLITEEVARRLDNRELLDLIFAPGLSTAEKVSEISGRGVGMDVVRSNIEKLNGSIEIKTEEGNGSEFRIKLPLTLAIIQALLVELGGDTFCIPLTSVLETISISKADINTIKTSEVIVVRGRVLPLIRLRRVFGQEKEGSKKENFPVVIVSLGSRQFGLAVDGLVGEQEVVIKSLGKFIGEVSGISGATILGDGSISLILDLLSLVESLGTQALTA